MNLKLKNLRVFTAVYQEKSVSGAAARLSMTQPRVSMAVRELEETYHTRLTEPEGRGIRFTQAGRELYRYALPIVTMCDELEQHMSGRKPGLRVGSSISIGTCMLPELVRAFEAQYPEVDVRVQINSSDLIEQAVLAGDLEVALIEGSVHSDRLVMEPYLDDCLVAICGRDDPLAQRKSVRVEELRDRKLLLRERNSATREMAESILTSNGVAVSPAWESTDTTALVNAVMAGIGVSILPQRVVQPFIDAGRVAQLHLEGIAFKRTYNIIYLKNKYLSEAALEFLRMADARDKTQF